MVDQVTTRGTVMPNISSEIIAIFPFMRMEQQAPDNSEATTFSHRTSQLLK
jgi:hypothetical protein